MQVNVSCGPVFVVVVVDDVDVADDARHKGLHSVVGRWSEAGDFPQHGIGWRDRGKFTSD